jgi:hypothetical protein
MPLDLALDLAHALDPVAFVQDRLKFAPDPWRVAPQAKQVASNFYDQGARSGEYVRRYAAQERLTAMLVAGAIGFALGYLIRGR